VLKLEDRVEETEDIGVIGSDELKSFPVDDEFIEDAESTLALAHPISDSNLLPESLLLLKTRSFIRSSSVGDVE
jgi:hypothetical protein